MSKVVDLDDDRMAVFGVNDTGWIRIIDFAPTPPEFIDLTAEQVKKLCASLNEILEGGTS